MRITERSGRVEATHAGAVLPISSGNGMGWFTASPSELTDGTLRRMRELGHNGRSRVAVNERSGSVIVGVERADGTADFYPIHRDGSVGFIRSLPE